MKIIKKFKKKNNHSFQKSKIKIKLIYSFHPLIFLIYYLQKLSQFFFFKKSTFQKLIFICEVWQKKKKNSNV